MIDGLSKRLLKSKFKSDHSLKSKCLNGLSKKYCQITKHEKHKIENKTNKARGKKPVTTYCLGCKDYTDNFKSQEVKMTNKILRVKSNCVACRSSKSRFLKQKDNNKK